MSIDPPHMLRLDVRGYPLRHAEDANYDAVEQLISCGSNGNYNGAEDGEPPYDPPSSTMRLTHLEAAANSIIGIALAQLVLFTFGVPLHEAVALNAVMIGVSYARSFVLRLVFARWAR